jgi:hypothetical protein
VVDFKHVFDRLSSHEPFYVSPAEAEHFEDIEDYIQEKQNQKN